MPLERLYVPAAPMAANEKYRFDAPIATSTSGPSLVTTKAQIQLKVKPREEQRLFASDGNISAFKVQGMQPRPKKRIIHNGLETNRV